jgi:hypothetical protein
MDIKEVRELSKKFTPEQIEGCITQQMETGGNVCLMNDNTEAIINELSKAQFVRELTDQGMDLGDALRELAKRMRQLQKPP